MGTDGKTPGGAAAAAESAASAARSATAARSAADDAMAAAARVAVEAALVVALVPINTGISELKAAIEKLTSDEATDDAAATEAREEISKTQQVLIRLQQQWLWICAGFFMLGAASAYVLLKAFE